MVKEKVKEKTTKKTKKMNLGYLRQRAYDIMDCGPECFGSNRPEEFDEKLSDICGTLDEDLKKYNTKTLKKSYNETADEATVGIYKDMINCYLGAITNRDNIPYLEAKSKLWIVWVARWRERLEGLLEEI
ncbi:MAG: hypothetical protein ABIH72_04815 [archaeon]